ncbi:MAG: HD domain-containing protein [Candidatus Caldarchaeales archaeon]
MSSWIFRLHAAANGLKSTERRGWRLRGVKDPESVADHSLALAVLSLAVAAARGLDPGKAAVIAVLHDIAEAYTGDLTPEEKDLMGDEKLSEIEDGALEKMLEGAPPAVRELVKEAVREYRSGSSPEAMLVRDLDKLEMALTAHEYRDQLGPEGVMEFLDSAARSVCDGEVSELIGGLVRGTNRS